MVTTRASDAIGKWHPPVLESTQATFRVCGQDLHNIPPGPVFAAISRRCAIVSMYVFSTGNERNARRASNGPRTGRDIMTQSRGLLLLFIVILTLPIWTLIENSHYAQGCNPQRSSHERFEERGWLYRLVWATQKAIASSAILYL